MSLTLGILLFHDAEELDFVGPWEVFTVAARAAGAATAAGAGGEKGPVEARVLTLAESSDEPVRAAKGLRVVADVSLAAAPRLDLLLVPGGEGTRREAQNSHLLEWIAKAASECRWVTSVCTGSLLLHAAGLTHGRRITTHWAFVDALRKRAADATVLDDVRYVRDGNVVTAAGVSAGIDMALWLVGQIWGEEHARRTQRYMQYDPAPPYTAAV